MRLASGLTAGVAVALLGIVLAAQPSSGAYTAAQAAEGRAAYDRHCAECHLADLKGSAGPELAGASFLSGWSDRPASELLATIRTSMPPGLDGSLSDSEYLDIVAYILQANGQPPGRQPLRRRFRRRDRRRSPGRRGRAAVSRDRRAGSGGFDAASRQRRRRRADPFGRQLDALDSRCRRRQDGRELHPGHRRAPQSAAATGLAELAANA